MGTENKKPKNDKPKTVRRPYDPMAFFSWVQNHALPSISVATSNVVKLLPPKAVRISNYGYESPSYQPTEMDWGSYIGAGTQYKQGNESFTLALLPVSVDGVVYHPAGVTGHTLKLLGLPASGTGFRNVSVGTKFSLSDTNDTFTHNYFIADTGSSTVDAKFPNMGTIDVYARDHTHYAYENITNPGNHSTSIPIKITLKGRLKPIKWIPGLVQYDAPALMSWFQSRPGKLASYNTFIGSIK